MRRFWARLHTGFTGYTAHLPHFLAVSLLSGYPRPRTGLSEGHQALRRLLSRYIEKIIRHSLRQVKRCYSAIGSPRHTSLLFVMGYGRSGTTMLQNLFERDLRIEVLGENEPRIAHDYMLVAENVNTVVQASRAEVIVLKPILNSFDAPRLLQDFPNAKVIWLIRNHKDVIASASAFFGRTVSDCMRDVVTNDLQDNWLGKGIPDALLMELRSIPTDTLSSHDWLALVWYAVNRTLIDSELCGHPRLLPIRYEDLVTRPEEILRAIYDFIGVSFNRRAALFINSHSIGKGNGIVLDPKVDARCTQLKAAIDKLCFRAAPS